MFRLSLVSLSVVGLCVTASADQNTEPPISCKKAKVKFDRTQIESDIEKFRRGETSSIESRSELIRCREAFPIFEKYMLDSDSNVRSLITSYFGYHILPERLPLFVKQIETYPAENTAIQYSYRYACRQFQKITPSSLTPALIKRIKSSDEDVHDQEIYLLGCGAVKDLQAKQFLEEMRKPTFRHKLTARERESQLENINYALAESGETTSENIVRREYEESLKDEDSTLQFLSGRLRGFTNCRILMPIASVILDERKAPASYLESTVKDLTVGDIAISVFDTVLQTGATGKESRNRKLHSVQEKRTIYNRVRKKLKQSGGCKTPAGA